MAGKLDAEFGRFLQVWESLHERVPCPIIQNNFELPLLRYFGNLDCSAAAGSIHFITQLNLRVAQFAREHRHVYISDINHLSARLGLNQWFDDSAWFNYKYALSVEAIPHLAHNVASLAKAIFGIAKKCLVMDLDNTLWGGIIGDDGVDNIQIGQGNPVAEAHSALQAYIKSLADRGVILAVCSKNDASIAKSGLEHPESTLRYQDFAAFRANWNAKHTNIADLAEELNLGVDSLVFLDDNPFERDIVKSNLPSVMVLEVEADISTYARMLDQSAAFEAVRVNEDDLQRSEYYRENSARAALRANFSDYEEYLRSLEMKAEIGPFGSRELDRITQLINKTNQFNLTTLRMSTEEVEAAAADANRLTLFGRLADKFGDNGLVSVVIGSLRNRELHINIWLMSCRVLNRGMEKAMFDAVCAWAQRQAVRSIFGYFMQSAKNQMVADHYKSLGFIRVEADTPRGSQWAFEMSNFKNLNSVIDVTYVG